MESSMEDRAYMDSLFVAGEVPKVVQHSVRLQRYFNQLDKIIDAGIAAKQRGDLPQAFMLFLRYINLGKVVSGHNAYHQKVYERDRRKLDRQMGAVLNQMEQLKPELLRRRRQSTAAPEPLPPALAAALASEVPQPEPEAVHASASSGGPRLVKVFGDGHCLYRSVASGLNPQLASLPRNDFGVIIDRGSRDLEEAAAHSLRGQVARYMEQNWDKFPTILAEERSVRLEGVRGSAWGGEEELLALSHVNGVQITVHSERDGRYSEHSYGAPGTDPGIHLRYTRNEERAALTGDPEAGGHYELLLM